MLYSNRNFVQNSTSSIKIFILFNFFQKQPENNEGQHKSYICLKTLNKPSSEHFNAKQKQLHPIEQSTSFPFNYFIMSIYP